MIKGFDCGASCAKYAARLAGDGYRFGCRYLTDAGDWRYFGPFEVAAMVDAGLSIVSIFETNADPAQFTAENGRRHVETAVRRARALGQPEGSDIYFAIDTDRARLDDVIAYFGAIQEANPPYRPSAYGPGKFIEMLRDELSMVAHGWLANAKAWPGYATFKDRADIVQGLPITPFRPDAFALDPNESALESGFGEWRPA